MALIISSALEIEVPENQSNQVIYVAVASDADNPNGQVVYSLAPGAHPNFQSMRRPERSPTKER